MEKYYYSSEKTSCFSFIKEGSVFLHGAFHWIDSSFSFNPVILAFDFEKEEFKEMAIPIKHLDDDRLKVIEGHLYVYDHYKEYRNENLDERVWS